MPTNIPETYPENGGYLAPSGVTVAANIAVATAYAVNHSALESYVWFFNQVRNGGPWDYKQQGNYQGFGNFNYGATGRAMGIPETVLHNMAGVAQLIAGTSASDWASIIWTSPSTADDPLDQAAILDGIEWADDQYQPGQEIIPVSPFVDLAVNSIMNMLLASQSPSDIANFAYALNWMSYENGSEFYMYYNYTDPNDPDLDAWGMLHTLQYYAERLGLTFEYDEVLEKVMLGVASPVVIDLGGDGLTTTAYSEHAVKFDIDGDGLLDKTAWLSGEDAFVVWDKNANGVVDGVQEMFGGLGRGDGYAKLAAFDTNNDGNVSALDRDFSVLKIWQDVNMNAQTDEGELMDLITANISSISVQYQSQELYQNSNLIGEISTAVIAGETVEVADIYFKYLPSGALLSPTDSAVASALQQVDLMVSAMAAFAPSSPGQTTLVPAQQSPLSPVIAPHLN